MADSRVSSFTAEADKVLQYLHHEFGKLQTGRANAALIEHVEVESYGQRMPLKAVASISVQDAKTIVIQPWYKSVLQAVEKAIQISNVGVNPVNDGTVIRLVLPPMTEERREQLKKVVHTLSEDARISIRQARQKALDAIKQDPNETLRKSVENQLQKEVDAMNGKIDDSRKKKEEEVMKI